MFWRIPVGLFYAARFIYLILATFGVSEQEHTHTLTDTDTHHTGLEPGTEHYRRFVAYYLFPSIISLSYVIFASCSFVISSLTGVVSLKGSALLPVSTI